MLPTSESCIVVLDKPVSTLHPDLQTANTAVRKKLVALLAQAHSGKRRSKVPLLKVVEHRWDASSLNFARLMPCSTL
jgi:hypothetical protein